jgi:anti-sigma B factor antagonist
MTDLKYPIEMVNGVPVVAAPEEIDVSNADCLHTVLREAAARGHERFVVDMTRTRFCASAGIGALARAHNRALADGGELRLVMPTSASVLRVFELTGIDQVIPHFPSLYEAVEPAPATPPPGHRDHGGDPSAGRAPARAGHGPTPARPNPPQAKRSPRSGARLMPRPVHRPAPGTPWPPHEAE